MVWKTMTKAFLKFNRSDAASLLCLRFWLESFREYETYILCDLYDINVDPVPTYLKSILLDYPVKIINTDYTIGKEYCQNLKGAKRGMASANMTCFRYITAEDNFWIIDADDTLFLTRDYALIQDKLKLAEQYLVANNLDGFSLDFYRNLNNGWTFGVCLLRGSMPWQLIKDVDMSPMVEAGFARNIDTAFDSLGRSGKIKLLNFVFDRLAFQHQINNYPDMPQGIYNWHRGNLWNKPLQPDVVIL